MLFNGKDLEAWQEPHGAWSIAGAVTLNPSDPKALVAQPGEGVFLNTTSGKGVNLLTKSEHGDCSLHMEFCVPQGSNSGIYLMGRYEVQILDSFGRKEIAEHDCGAIYQRWKDGKGYEGHAPMLNASKAPGEWQSFDIVFQAPRFDAAGAKVQNAKFIKVTHNGRVIHENVEVTGPTRGSRFEQEAPAGPIVLQGDHGPVAFRNLRLVVPAPPGKSARSPDLLGIVRRFADAMIDRSRSQLPHPERPLFPIVLTRDTFQIPKGKVGNLVTARVPQEFKTIANPHHDLNLYQVLYALGKLTGEAKYGAEADRVLGYFLKNCQEPKYGFFCWGEHIGWDVIENAPGGFPRGDPKNGEIHEFYRPWIYWEKSFDVAPEECLRFARALWNHQLDHKGTISFSRHAMIASAGGPSRRGKEFPRHGGFYIATWAAAYRRTSDPEMLKAIDAMVAFYESHRDPKTGAIPHGTDDFAFERDGTRSDYVYTQSPVSLAVDLEEAAPALPEALRKRMQSLAASIDRSFLALAHDPGPGGKGFVLFASPRTLAPTEYWMTPEDIAKGVPPRRQPWTGGWRSAYVGQHPHTWVTPALIARYQQTGSADYKRLLLACADNYLASDPDASLSAGSKEDVEAGSIGNVMVLLNAAFQMTRDDKYLARAEWFGAWAARRFWPDDSPLPRASVRENIYSAASRCDTLAMAMLQTSLLRHQPERASEVSLIATDR